MARFASDPICGAAGDADVTTVTIPALERIAPMPWSDLKGVIGDWLGSSALNLPSATY